MSDINEINKCFEPLKKRLFEIEFYTNESSIEFQKSLIFESIQNGILGFDNEETLLIIDIFLDKIKSILPKLNSLVSTVDFKKKEPTSFDFQNPNPSKLESKKAEKIQKDLLLNSLKSELSIYSNRLNEIKIYIEEEYEMRGSERFSNAGFKVRLNLTVEEIGCLFGLFYENNIIDKSSIKKIKLANFISKNFYSINKQDELSTKSLANVLKSKNSSEKAISDKLVLLNFELNKLPT